MAADQGSPFMPHPLHLLTWYHHLLSHHLLFANLIDTPRYLPYEQISLLNIFHLKAISNGIICLPFIILANIYRHIYRPITIVFIPFNKCGA